MIDQDFIEMREAWSAIRGRKNFDVAGLKVHNRTWRGSNPHTKGRFLFTAETHSDGRFRIVCSRIAADNEVWNGVARVVETGGLV